MKKLKPKCLTKAEIRKVYSLPEAVLNGWIDDGWVKALKTGKVKSCSVLVSVADVERCLADLEQDLVPRRAQRVSTRGAKPGTVYWELAVKTF